MKPYISWSELWLYTKDQNQYYTQYIMGVKEPPTRDMIFGSIIHDALSGKIENHLDIMTEEHFTSGEIRVANEILKKAPKPEPIAELPLLLVGDRNNGLRCNVLSIFDRVDFKNNIIREYKTTRNGWSRTEEIKRNGQLALYSLIYKSIRTIKPLIILTRLDTKNGKVKEVPFFVEDTVIEKVKSDINEMYDKLIANGWWARRTGTGGQLYTEAKKNAELYAHRKN